jgi:hypothetical protein
MLMFFMKNVLSIIFIGLFFGNSVFANTLDLTRKYFIYDNLMADYARCHYYFLFLADSVVVNDSFSKNARDEIISNSKLAGELSFEFREKIDLSIEAMVSRQKLYVNNMIDLIGNNIKNIDVLSAKYKDLCAALIISPQIRYQHWIDKAHSKW